MEQNLRNDIRNLICEISFFKNIIERNYSNINSQTSLIDKKSVVNNSKIQNGTKNLDFNEFLIDFIVESENNQDKSNEKIKNNVEKEINVFVETNRNELELKSNGNVDYNNEKEITAVEKQLIDLRRRRHEEYLDYRLSTNTISGNEKEASYLAPNIQLVSSNSNKTDSTSLRNLSGKSIKKTEGRGNKNPANTLKKQKKEKDNQQILEKRQIIDRSGVWKKGTCAIAGDSMLNGIDERRISKTHPVKVRFFPGARIKNMHHYLIPILDKKPEPLILHIETNYAANSSHQQIVNDL